MKITRIQAFAHGAPTLDLRGDPRNYCYVRVVTDAGLHGWGEATCGSLTVVPMVEELGRALVGSDPFVIQHLWQRMYNCHHNVRGGVIHMAALSGIDVALCDIKGKALGVPVHQLLGGAVRDGLWCYGRFDGGDAGEAVAHARREVGREFTALKADPFSSLGPHLAGRRGRGAYTSFL
jgi:galactonate dehydratase